MGGDLSYQEELSRSESKTPAGADHDAPDSDAAKLAGMGYTQEMERGFSKWSLLGGKLSNSLGYRYFSNSA